jgi:hypothetical protein
MNLTTKVTLIQQYMDRNGNIYPANLPYLYGQLPEDIRDNGAYVKSLETVEITLEPYQMINVDEIDTGTANRPERVKKQVVKQRDLIETTEITKV